VEDASPSPASLGLGGRSPPGVTKRFELCLLDGIGIWDVDFARLRAVDSQSVELHIERMLSLAGAQHYFNGVQADRGVASRAISVDADRGDGPAPTLSCAAPIVSSRSLPSRSLPVSSTPAGSGKLWGGMADAADPRHSYSPSLERPSWRASVGPTARCSHRTKPAIEASAGSVGSVGSVQLRDSIHARLRELSGEGHDDVGVGSAQLGSSLGSALLNAEPTGAFGEPAERHGHSDSWYDADCGTEVTGAFADAAACLEGHGVRRGVGGVGRRAADHSDGELMFDMSLE